MRSENEHNEKFKTVSKIENQEGENQTLKSKAQLSIGLDRYEDIFSDFDPRPFNERTLSDDFLIEARKMAKEKHTGIIELKLLIPEKSRDKFKEEVIVRSLHSHFKKFAGQQKLELKNERQVGLLYWLLGILIMIGAAWFAGVSHQSFGYNALRVILEPAGWFFVWTGFEYIFFNTRKKRPELNFMIRMAHADIKFLSF